MMNTNGLRNTVLAILCVGGCSAPALAYMANRPAPVTFTAVESSPARVSAPARQAPEIVILPETRIVVSVNRQHKASKKVNGPVTCEIGFIESPESVRVYRFCASPMFRAPVITKNL